MNTHICQHEHASLPDMRALYAKLSVLPTSMNADVILIRSHVAYWSGLNIAERATIKPSRGHSYRVKSNGVDRIVRIKDYYDHRNGITGWCI
jgi:hypothetical protein